MKKLLDPSEISDSTFLIIKKLYEDNIDFRAMNNFKNKLLDSPKLIGNYLSVEDYLTIKH